MDPLADMLANAERNKGGQPLRVDILFGDRPDVLAGIVKARTERKVSAQQIAKILSTEGEPVSEAAVLNWLRSKGHE